ncbi:DUF6134 family protein [Pelagibacteraceae bacterium]|nr:DUF6134 family protein [Pelagibacteraceae bacterium]MDC3232685.1 DUF6134 family protein [Pelagibacteraceae bacterium]
MKKFILSIAIFLLFSSKSFGHVEHYANYNYLEYELFRNNQSIGYHKYDFKREGDNLSIFSEVSFKIKKLGVDLYKYFAKSEEIYENGIFKSYKSKTKQNKKDRYVNINIDPANKSLIIDGSSYKGKASKNFIVGTWWNHEIIKAKAQISGISGRVIEQSVTFIGKEEVTIGDKTYKTLHFNFRSSDETLPESKRLNTDIWYEEETFLWVKAAFDKSGYWEYRVKTYK